MNFKSLFRNPFRRAPANRSPGTDFPQDGILWHEWNDLTRRSIAEKNRPVLLFVANTDGTIWPFLREVLKAMPLNPKLRELLNDHTIGVFMKVEDVPEFFRDLGAGSRYHIAILSPAGLTPLATIDPTKGKPKEIVGTISKILEELKKVY